MRTCLIIRKAQILFVVVTLITLAMLAAGWSTKRDIRSATRQLTEQVDGFQLKALELRLCVVQVQQWLTDISATRGLDGLNDGFDQAASYAGRAGSIIDSLQTMDPEYRQQYQELRNTFDSYYATGRKMAELYVAEGPSGGNKYMGTFDQVAATMSAAVEQLVKRAEQRKSAIAATLEHEIDVAAWIIGLLSMLLGGVMLGGVFYLIRLLKPLISLRAVAQNLTSKDLSAEVPAAQGKHEIALLVQSFGQMRDGLRAALQQIRQSTEDVASSAKSVANVAQQTHGNVTRQQVELQGLEVAIGEMDQTVREISASTTAAADAANSADQNVGNGAQVMDNTVRTINRLSAEVESGTQVMGQLEAESSNIGSVLDVIRGIAEQTNLLALNAAIEAARAGEQGRGFAVVADEVRTLASRTQQSTQEIQDMIERLQHGAREASSVMKRGRDAAGDAVTEIALAGEALDTIRQSVTTIRDMSIQIASAAEEQSAVSGSIRNNVVGIREAMDDTVAGSEQASSISAGLDGQANALRAVVGEFKF